MTSVSALASWIGSRSGRRRLRWVVQSPVEPVRTAARKAGGWLGRHRDRLWFAALGLVAAYYLWVLASSEGPFWH